MDKEIHVKAANSGIGKINDTHVHFFYQAGVPMTTV